MAELSIYLQYKQEKEARGLCAQRGCSNPKGSSSLCGYHTSKNRLRDKTEYHTRKEMGLCVECNAVLPTQESVRCIKCRTRKNNHRRYRRRTGAENQENQKKQIERKRKRKIFSLPKSDLHRFNETACAICGQPPAAKRLALDHCHRTGRLRGLLCSNCNTAIGLLNDNPDLARKAAKYLDSTTIFLSSMEDPAINDNTLPLWSTFSS